ncbi:sigma-70 family RNA polymerase sigma factor [Paracoccus beibuensis]|uniref:sigma-70 family RNA polymerase sigma factor n=1 Tax=Paracoccus beibuensis TaxID=547602 RepID=UPI0022403ED4|nr:sigma-70 family RNA polymerase sigma factor [Paracoccus beibuensis]
MTLSTRDSNKLLRDFLPFAEKTVRAFVRRHPDLDAHEVESRAMEAYWLTIDLFDPQRGLSFATYAGARMKGRMRDYARTERARRKAYRDFVEEHPYDDIDTAHGPDLIEQADADRALQGWLDRIKDSRHREALISRLQGMTSPEIAALAGVDSSTVCRWLQRARKIIQDPTS